MLRSCACGGAELSRLPCSYLCCSPVSSLCFHSMARRVCAACCWLPPLPLNRNMPWLYARPLCSMARLDKVKNLTGLAEWYASSPRLRSLVNLVIVGEHVWWGIGKTDGEHEITC